MDNTLVEFCPKCNAQLPPGLEKCPNCGHRLRSKGKGEFSLRDIFWMSVSVLGIVLLPVLIVIGVVWLIISRLK
jgi:ribosomal protein L40E